jgi:hypothetical protein
MNKIKILIILLVYSGIAYCQKGVNFEKDCLLNNSLIMAEVLYQSIEKDSLNIFLEKNINFTMVCDLNSSGQFLGFRKIWNQHALSKNILSKIEKKLLQEKIYFYVCYELESQSRKKEIIESIDKRGYVNIAINFPGEIISLYSCKNMHRKGARTLSKYDFIKDLITK